MLPNPFVGPRPLSSGNPIFGRDREIAELANLLIANRLVLLLSPSGAGKSSLVNAGLIPELSGQFEVFPPARVNAELPPGSSANRYVASVLNSWKYQGPETSLCTAVAPSSKPPLLIFDQFEEIIRIDPNDIAGQGEFFRQLAALVAQPTVWLLVVIREDYLAPLLPWFAQLPSHLRSRFRLDFLTTDQAQLAIRETAAAGGRTFAPKTPHKPEALSSLVSNLAAIQIQKPDGSFAPSAVPGVYIEPMHLQIVCRRLWDNMPDNDLSIDPEDVEKFGDINQALGDYYDNAVRTRAAANTARERAIREWFERSLITPSRTRGQVQFTFGKSGGIENSVIDSLLETHLVRAERRRGVTWYELSHDRLIEPVLVSNQAWFRDNLSDLQRLTTLWLDRDKIEGLLLSGTVLEESEAWAADHPDLVTPAESEFLEKSRQRAEAAAREARLNRELTVALVHAALREAGQAAARNESSYALAHYAAALRLQPDSISARRGICLLLLHTRWWMPVRLYDVDDWVRAVAVNSDASRFVIGTVNLTSKLWDTSTDEQVGEPFQHPGLVYSVAFDPSNALFYTIDGKHTVRTFSASTGAPLSAPIVHGAYVQTAVFSPIPGDLRLVTASDDGTARVWNAVTGQPLSPPLVHPGPVLFALFSPDGKHIRTSGGPDGLTLWDASSGKPLKDRFRLDETVTCASYSADGAMLAIGTQEGWAYIWDTTTAKKTCPPLNHDGRVKSIAFSSSGGSLLTATFSSVHHWDLPSGKPLGQTIRCGTYVRAVSLSPGDQFILVVSGEGPARVWDAFSGLPAGDAFLLDVQTEMACFDPRFPGTFSATRFKGAVHRRPLPRHSASVPRLLGNGDVYFEEFGLSPATDTLWVRYRERAVRFWDVNSGELRESLKLSDGDPDAIVAYSHSTGRLLIANPDGTAQLFDAATKTPIGDPLLYFAGTGIARFSPDGTLLVTSVDRDAVQRWDASTGAPFGDPLVHLRPVPHAAFSPDGQFLVTYCWDDSANLWPASDPGAEPNPFPNEQPVSPSQFSPGGDLLVLFNKELGAVLWHIANGTMAGPPMPHRGEAKSVVFSPAGDRLLIASSDGAVRIWDLKAGNVLRSVLLHPAPPAAAAFHPDGTLVATAAGDRVYFWDVESGARVGPPLVHDLDVAAVAFSPAGDLLITAESFRLGDVRIWPFDPEGSLSGDVNSFTRAAAAVGGYAVNEYGSLVPVPSQIAECNRIWNDEEQPPGPFTDFIRQITDF